MIKIDYTKVMKKNLKNVLKAKNVKCFIKGWHSCVTMRVFI